jgi:hypothetical protein
VKIFIKTLLEDVWTNHYNQPPNSTLGGLHMTQTTHDFVKWANPTKTYQSGHVVGGNGGLKIFYLKCLWACLKKFHSTFSNHLGGFS